VHAFFVHSLVGISEKTEREKASWFLFLLGVGGITPSLMVEGSMEQFEVLRLSNTLSVALSSEVSYLKWPMFSSFALVL
jgi:hypothetical protein